eukprot:16243-Amphidinium_carterae.2
MGIWAASVQLPVPGKLYRYQEGKLCVRVVVMTTAAPESPRVGVADETGGRRSQSVDREELGDR